jgi:hypothetical protein
MDHNLVHNLLHLTEDEARWVVQVCLAFFLCQDIRLIAETDSEFKPHISDIWVIGIDTSYN